ARVHDWAIPQREYDRQLARRGRLYAYEALAPVTTALVVVDMVPFFTRESPYCRGVIPNINALATALRSAGGTIAWVLPSADARSAAHAAEFFGPAVAKLYAASGGEGALPSRLAPELESLPDDLFVEKTAASAFFPGRSDLHERLQALGVDTVIVTGTVTNVCCEGTARDASTLGYRVIMAADGCATVNDAMHNATLTTVYRSFGDVRTTAEILAFLS
ncbi:isochorismatase family cysteine hydrolase, partial [Phenylobacterium sp.]|uniref:isochorismatase family cysteine hydrolase n=1 Tax=Phenylobacterium sp. TaxID=1871053 RepID=UPI002E2FFBF6